MKRKLIFFCLLIYIATFSQKNNIKEADIRTQINKAREISGTDPDKALKMLEKSKADSKKNGYKQGILDSNNTIMILYFWKGNYKTVVEISEEAEKIAKELKNYELLSDTYRLKGVSYIGMGIYKIGLQELEKALEEANKMEQGNPKYFQNAVIYDNIAEYYTENSLDSTIIYKKKSLKETEKMNDSPKAVNQKYQMIAFQYMNLGTIYSEQNKIDEAEKYFLESLKIYKSKKYPLIPKNEEIILYSELGKFYSGKKDYKKAITYAQEGLSLEKNFSVPYIRKDLYEVLFKSYIEIENPALSKKYSSLYTALSDSIKIAEKSNIDTPIKQILSEQSAGHTTDIIKILIGMGIILCISGTLGWYLWRKNQKKLHTKYEIIIENLKKAETTNDQNTPLLDNTFTDKNTGINITDSTVSIILAKLNKFENSTIFIQKDMSISFLAHELNTNTRYLSEIIKQYKGGNYNSYINSLRINYITNKLYQDSKYRNYKISYLAEACGFTSRDVFTITFKKETGVTPSYFINNLKKDYEA